MVSFSTIKAYLRKTGMREVAFGRLSVNDPSLLIDLRKGRTLGPKISARIAKFMEDNPNGVNKEHNYKKAWDVRRARFGRSGRRPSKLSNHE